MATDTRTIRFTIDPALKAYYAWLDAEGRKFVFEEYDLFAAGYRWRDTEPAPAASTEHQPCQVRGCTTCISRTAPAARRATAGGAGG